MMKLEHKKAIIATQHIEYLKREVVAIPLQIKKAQTFIERKTKELQEKKHQLTYFTND